ncbi:hypothetical protein NW762_009518 [Fusarium torreyae]|uniref:Cell wall protein n=1 Tax=Fusarium torreyae TaxID=1237075 RepID=A0A9W8RWS0_9HYPO|nr:hypothetical protein NW762_009518 [Fusarium torreyae]
MAVFKLKALASVLAIVAPYVAGTGVDGETGLSAQISTDAAVTQQVGSATSDGTILYTMSVCAVTHQTECTMVVSTSGEALPSVVTNMPSVPVGGQPSVPAGGEPTTYHGEGMSSPSEGAPAPSETGVEPSGASAISEPGYSAPAGTSPGGEPVPVPVPSGGGEPVTIPSVIISTTDASGNPTVLTTAYDEPSVTDIATATVTGSETVYDTTIVSGTATDGNPSSADGTEEVTPTGTPSVTATGAAQTLSPGAALAIAGILIAVVI